MIRIKPSTYIQIGNPRSTLVSFDATSYYYCVTRCVRCTFLCSDDPYTGQSFYIKGQIMIEIQTMKIKDYEQVVNLWSESEGMTLRDADSKESIESYLTHNPGLSFVATKGGDIVGAVLAGTDGRRGYLQHLAVCQTVRSNGIGKQLVEKVLSALNQIGISKTHLFVHNENINAQQFYARLGWQLRDEVRMYSFNTSNNLDV